MLISAILNEAPMTEESFVSKNELDNRLKNFAPLSLSRSRFPSANFEVDPSFAGGGGEVNSLKPFGAAEQKASRRVSRYISPSLPLNFRDSGYAQF